MSKKCKNHNYEYIKTHSKDSVRKFSDGTARKVRLHKERYKCKVCNHKKTISFYEFLGVV